MFEFFGLIFKGFIFVWMGIIASIPNIFMAGLSLCIGATVMTYFLKKLNP
ncbi:MAG: hypothetical protein OEZ59_09880 [Deltaproteobacteria bacterium]|nr:hypothetical protein [Deltaproteobacteria bacterium]